MEGTISNARNGSGVSTASIILQQQVVSGGSFNSNFVAAASSLTDGSGFYTLEWKRENVADFQLNVSKSGWIEKQFDLNPDDFSTEDAYQMNASLYPEAFIDVHLHNDVPSASTDLCNFRFDDADFDCTCCNDNWRYFSGTATDTNFTCRLYGDQWLKYLRQLITDDLDTLLVDSVWCPSFQTTSLDVGY